MPMKANQPDSDLERVVREACCALARLDSDRLDEIGRRCESLDASFRPLKREEQIRQAHGLAREMAIFARVLEATRANMEVMERIRSIRAMTLEYRENGAQKFVTGNCDGLH